MFHSTVEVFHSIDRPIVLAYSFVQLYAIPITYKIKHQHSLHKMNHGFTEDKGKKTASFPITFTKNTNFYVRYNIFCLDLK